MDRMPQYTVVWKQAAACSHPGRSLILRRYSCATVHEAQTTRRQLAETYGRKGTTHVEDSLGRIVLNYELATLARMERQARA